MASVSPKWVIFAIAWMLRAVTIFGELPFLALG